MSVSDEEWAKLQADWRAAVVAGLAAKAGRRSQSSYVATPVTNWQEAENAAAAHMRALGFTDARKSASGADSGIDVVSTRAVAQVKARGARTSRPEVQNLHGAAPADALRLFYSTSGYTTHAQSFAATVQIALFTLARDGSVEAVNAAAEAQLSRGHRGFRARRLKSR